jgi:deoxyribose-phosphate aldolase
VENTSSIIQNILDQRVDQRNLNWHYRLLSFIDYTTLEGTDTHQKVKEMCAKAKTLFDQCGHTVAAICVYPNFIESVKKELQGYPVKVASVAAAFPSGQTHISVKVAEVNYCIDSGADEIDIVISRGKLIENNVPEVELELAQLRKAAQSCILKTIIESGELETTERIAQASKIAIANGADFIKTSTGKAKTGATLLAHYTMMQAIANHKLENRTTIGMKPSGGITTIDDASSYMAIAEHFMDEDYLQNSTFRIGASSLLSNVVKRLSELNSNIKPF